MKIFIPFLLLLSVSCASNKSKHADPPQKVEIHVPTPHSEKVKEARLIYLEASLKGSNLDIVLNSVLAKLNDNTYILSSVLPPNINIQKDRAIHFLIKPLEQKIQSKDIATVRLEKNIKYQSYKLSIEYRDKRGRKKTRNWLYSLNFDDEQIEKSVQKTIIRFAFQSL